MSKEIEALHRIANAKNHFKYDTLELVDKDFQIVQQGLLRLDRLDAAMELLPDQFSAVNNREIFIMRKEMFEKFQKQEKVLKIIFEKQVDIMWLYQCIEANRTFEDYNSGMGRELEYLTQEEFDTLKRYCDESNRNGSIKTIRI